MSRFRRLVAPALGATWVAMIVSVASAQSDAPASADKPAAGPDLPGEGTGAAESREGSADPAPVVDAHKTQCAVAYEAAQETRAAGKLQLARERLLVCAQPRCASFIQSDCTQWLAEVQRDLPSVVFAAKTPTGEEGVDAKVLLNGKVLAQSLDGRAVVLDPGMHHFEFRLDGFESVTKQVAIRQGEKNRVVAVTFGGDAPVQPVADVAEKPVEEPRSDLRHLRPLAYVGWGLGAGGLAAAFFLNQSARSQEDDFLAACEVPPGSNTLSGLPGCTPGDLDRVRSEVDDKLLFSAVSLSAGLASAVAGTVLFFVTQSNKSTNDQGLVIDLSPRFGSNVPGGQATVRGSF